MMRATLLYDLVYAYVHAVLPYTLHRWYLLVYIFVMNEDIFKYFNITLQIIYVFVKDLVHV